jgi:hypothetical protein
LETKYDCMVSSKLQDKFCSEMTLKSDPSFLSYQEITFQSSWLFGFDLQDTSGVVKVFSCEELPSFSTAEHRFDFTGQSVWVWATDDHGFVQKLFAVYFSGSKH